jgi:integrase
MERFTEIGVRKLKPPPKPQRIDKIHTITRGLGLALRLSYSGSKTWRVLYYVNGRPSTKTLGKFPDVSVSEAYKKARKFDPEAANKHAAVGTFKQVAEDYLLNHVQAEGLRTQNEIVRCLNKYVYPSWGSKPFAKIRRGEVTALRDEIRNNHGKRQANVVVTILSGLMNWYAIRNEDYVTPIVKGMRFKTQTRERTLSDAEIKLVWEACDGTFGDIVKLLLLTAQRREKVTSMRWADLKDGVWVIPAEPREKSNAGTLRLPPMAREIVEARYRIAENPYVFVGRTKGGCFNSFSQGKAELDERLPKDMPQWQLHDLRRTARSLMSRAGVTPHVAERVLGHVIGGVEGTYDRHGYDAEKGHALEALASLVERIINPPEGENVVAYPRKAEGAKALR